MLYFVLVLSASVLLDSLHNLGVLTDRKRAGTVSAMQVTDAET